MNRPLRSDPLTDDSLTPLRIARLASLTVLGLGIILRLLELLRDRSLSQDEAQLALNIMDRPLTQLFGQLDFNQAAPEAFLAVQKLVVETFGGNDYSLRLFPFVAGTLSLVLILFLARRFVSPLAVPLAVGLFAFSDSAIYYTTSDKQYAVDVAIAVLVLLVGNRLLDRPRESSSAILFAGVGATSIWLSHSSVFVLAGVSAALFVGSVARKQWRSTLQISAASSAWLVSFGVFALTSLDNVARIRHSLHNTGVFPGSGSISLTDTGPLRTSLGAFRYIAGIPHFLEHGHFGAGELVAALAAGFCITGFVSLATKHPAKALALLGPLGFMLIAWGLGQYPLLGRTQLFLVPIYVLLLAEGVIQLTTTIRHPGARAASIIAAGLVGVAVAVPAVKHVVSSPTFNEMKPVLEYIARKQRPGDTIYVYYTAQPQLRYFLECGCAGPRFQAAMRNGLWPLRPARGGPEQFAPAMRSVPPTLIVAQDQGITPSAYARDFDTLRGRTRVWVLAPEIEEPIRTSLLRELDRRGTRRATFGVGNVDDFASAVVVYLYDMSQPRRASTAP